MYQAKSGVKNFSLYRVCVGGGGGPLTKKFFFQSEHVSSQICCQNFFLLLCVRGGGALTKKFFFQSEHVSSQIWCQNFFPLPVMGGRGGSPDKKIFFPVWTCIKPNLVSKIFPFTGWGKSLDKKIFFPVWTCIKPNLLSKFFPFTVCRGGGALTKKFFFQSEHVSSQIWCQKFFPLLGGGSPLTKKFFFQSEHVSSQICCQNFFLLLCVGGGVPWQKNFFSSLNMYQAKSGVKIFSFYCVSGGGCLDKKIFFPVWTCIKPNLVSKFFPFTSDGGEGGSPRQKNFFSSLNMYQAKSGVKIFSFYCVSGGGVPWQKNFFSSLNMYQAKSGVKIFSFYCVSGGGCLDKKIFFPVWTCIKPNLVSKFFPFTSDGGEGGSPRQKIFFSSLNMYQAKSGVKIFSFYCVSGGGCLDKKIFFPVWTCIKPNLVSKFFPFTSDGGEGGSPRQKNFFSSLNMYQAKSGVKNFSLYWVGEVPWQKNFFSSLNMYQAKSAVKIFSFYCVLGGGALTKKFFFQSEHVSSQICCQNFFPLPVMGGRGGSPQQKNFFSSLNMYQAKSGVKNFSLYWVGGGPLTKKFFFQSEHVSSQICCQKFFPLLRPGTHPPPQVWIDTQSENITFRHPSDAGGKQPKSQSYWYVQWVGAGQGWPTLLQSLVLRVDRHLALYQKVSNHRGSRWTCSGGFRGTHPARASPLRTKISLIS